MRALKSVRLSAEEMSKNTVTAWENTDLEKLNKTMTAIHQVAQDVTIYKTRNHTILSPNPENRPMDQDQVNRMVSEMNAGNNQLASNPIAVNENLMIIKGHHRYAAAVQAKVDIYYVIIPGLTLQDAIKEDVLTKHWTTQHHLDRYANIGKPDYVVLKKFWKEYPWLTISNLIRLCSVGGYKKNNFPNGRYSADRVPFARKICDMALDFKPYFKEWHSKIFLDAMLQIGTRQEYSHNRMIRKIEYQASKLQRQATVQQYLDVLSNIYNFKEKEENHVFFRKSKKHFPAGQGYGIEE